MNQPPNIIIVLANAMGETVDLSTQNSDGYQDMVDTLDAWKMEITGSATNQPHYLTALQESTG